MRSLLIACLLAALGEGTALRGADLEGLPVVRIEFEPRTQPLTREYREELLVVQQGSPLQRQEVGESIRNLFASGRYADVQVSAEAVEGGVKLVFKTKPSWFVGQVRVTGVPPPPTPLRLVNAAGLKLGELYTDEDSAFARQQILQLLQDNGYAAATVDEVNVRHSEFQQVDIDFQVTPGPRAGIGKLFVTPNAREAGLDEAQARRIAGWDLDKPFTQDRIQRGIERLKKHFRRRDYWQVQVRALWPDYDPDDNRQNMVLDVDRGPRVTVRVEGDELSGSQLRRYLPIYEEGVVDEDLLAEGADNLRDYLQTRGYFAANVEYFRERDDAEEVEILYRIERGPRQRLVRVAISGNRFFDLGTIRERMLTQEKSFNLRRGRFSQGLIERDKEVIEDLYRSNGFRDVTVSHAVEENYLGRAGDLSVSVKIEEGPQTLVEDLIIQGAEEIPADAFYYQLASVPGQPYSELSVATDRDLILAQYFDSGYQDAELSWRVLPTEEENRVILEYQIREGESLLVRRPIVSGLDHTRESLVDGQMQIRPGTPLSQSSMFETQRRLYDLGIFSRVNVGLQNPNGEEPAKNVLLQVEEARRWTVGVGGGAEFARIGGNQDPTGQTSFGPRMTLELTRLNVRGIGHTLSVRTRFSQLQQRALFTYEAPRWTGSDHWDMTVSGLWDTSRNVLTFSARRLEGAFQLQQRLSKPSTALYRYTYRRTTISDPQINQLLIPLFSQAVRVGLISGTYIQDRRDDPTDATKGIFNTVDLSFASGLWGSARDFSRVLGQNTTYHHLGGRVVFARTLQLGLIVPYGSLDEEAPIDLADLGFNPDLRIPLPERFFAGGANSHRGFAINQAGPRDPVTGFPIGAGAQLLNSLELRFPLRWQNIGGVLFHDAGNAYSRTGRISFNPQQQPILDEGRIIGYDFDYMVHAVGLGVRYRTPIGPLRLDFGYSLNPPRFAVFEGDPSDFPNGPFRQDRISRFQFHFSLGQTF